MSETRIIKKYPNRRLYDTQLSTYITLEDVRRLVLERTDLRVVDAKTGEDITRSVLLQIIMEQEEDGEPIFTTQILTQIIRYYGDSLQGAASDFLQRSLAMFAEQQKLIQQQVRDAVVTSPLAAMTELSERNLALWRDMQKAFLAAAAGPLEETRRESRRERGADRGRGAAPPRGRKPGDGPSARNVKGRTD